MSVCYVLLLRMMLLVMLSFLLHRIYSLYYIAAILQVRLHHSRRRRQIQFLVQCDGRPVEEATWEPIDVFYHTPSLADQAPALAALVDSSTSDVAPVVDPPGLATA